MLVINIIIIIIFTVRRATYTLSLGLKTWSADYSLTASNRGDKDLFFFPIRLPNDIGLILRL